VSRGGTIEAAYRLGRRARPPVGLPRGLPPEPRSGASNSLALAAGQASEQDLLCLRAVHERALAGV
jgi:hypothetical protein